MTTVADLPQDLIDRVRALSPAQQAALRATLPAPAPAGDPELKALLTRRWEDYQSGRVQAIPIDDFIHQLDERIEERRQK